MRSLPLARGLVLASMFALAGCPSSTTRENDAGRGDDAASGNDAASGDDAASGSDAGAGPVWSQCSATSQCGLASAGCCSPCGAPTLDEVDAINLSQMAAHFSAVCPAPTPCPACVTGNNPNLLATCTLGHCMAFDVSQSALSACTSDAECVIRYANCCSCTGDASQVIAVRSDAESAIEAALCDGGACALDCAMQMDPGFHAACDLTSGHCVAIAN